ncbi:MAG: hypothetical protein MZV70_54510 [Desulfobacterales bacterium]|nr:hypothetical protein [Desulfobacterales bacterium]
MSRIGERNEKTSDPLHGRRWEVIDVISGMMPKGMTPYQGFLWGNAVTAHHAVHVQGAKTADLHKCTTYLTWLREDISKGENMQRFQGKRLVVPARKFDRYEKPWPADVMTVVGDGRRSAPGPRDRAGECEPEQRRLDYLPPSGPIAMPDSLFHMMFEEHVLQLELSVGIGEPIKEVDHGKS